jgi:NodT family efflux transporter outer membrane factor (OMF) lipoprotein
MRWIPALVAAIAAGCSVGINYKTPPTTAPSKFGETSTRPTTRQTSGPSTGPTTNATNRPLDPAALAVWWKSFKDPELNSLMDRAVKNNNTYLQAQARVRQARAQLGIEIGAELPTLSVTGEATRQQLSKTVSSGVSSSGTSGSSNTGSGTSGLTSTEGTAGSSHVSSIGGSARRPELYEAGFDAGWEIDVFGGGRRAIEAAADDLEAQIDARRYALVTLTSEVGNDYMLYRAYQAELKLTHDNLTSEEDTLKLTQSRFNAGLTSDLDVAQAEASVATTAAQIPTLVIEIQQEIHALSILLGEPPMALAAELEKVAPIPPMPPEVPTGLPSDLIRRRPDVRQAERLLGEQTANIGVAVANLFPKFSLTGSLGQESSRFGLTAKNISSVWSFGPTVSWQLLDYYQLQSQVRVANAIQVQAFYNYRAVVLQSFGDVEDALIAYSQDQVRTKTLIKEVNADQRSVDLSLQLYQRGLGDFLNVLTAERSLYSAQSDMTTSESNVATDLVRLYKALGGGWDEHDEQRYNKNEDPKAPAIQ